MKQFTRKVNYELNLELKRKKENINKINHYGLDHESKVIT